MFNRFKPAVLMATITALFMMIGALVDGQAGTTKERVGRLLEMR